MIVLNEKQLAEVSGGCGCVCQPSDVRFVALNEAVCEARCCVNSVSYCTFQDGATPMHAVNLASVNLNCNICP